MGEDDGLDIDVDFSGDGEGHIPDAHLTKRFPVTEVIVNEIDLSEAA